MSAAMTLEERERLSVRAIRVTLRSALRYAQPDEATRCKVRAQELLAYVRGKTTVAAVLAEIDVLQAELDGDAYGRRLVDG